VREPRTQDFQVSWLVIFCYETSPILTSPIPPLIYAIVEVVD
jgi:hypothetical protein